MILKFEKDHPVGGQDSCERPLSDRKEKWWLQQLSPAPVYLVAIRLSGPVECTEDEGRWDARG